MTQVFNQSYFYTGPWPALDPDPVEWIIPEPLPQELTARFVWAPLPISSKAIPETTDKKPGNIRGPTLYSLAPLPKRSTADTFIIRKSILDDLHRYGIPDNIAREANSIYVDRMFRVTTSRRGKRHVRLLYYCTYCAYIELNIYVDELDLADRFQLDYASAQQAITEFDVSQTGYSPPPGRYTGLDPIPNYCRKMGFSEETAVCIINASRPVLQKSQLLSDNDIKGLAVALIYYYYLSHGCDYLNILAYVSGITTITIAKTASMVAAEDNR